MGRFGAGVVGTHWDLYGLERGLTGTLEGLASISVCYD